jgi:alpha-glucosidase (family GH31 glycosyl hydrolase)
MWNDMNEPSVFKGSVEIEQLGMPMNNSHFKADGTKVEHRWLHNAYGALMHRSTYQGLAERDNNQLRPFVLTRSFFFGSQRYGAMWTGDSLTEYWCVPASVSMLLQLGVTGIVFGGTDLPGFEGNPTDDLFVQFYQLGVFMPFFRAHAGINNPNREPWL